MSGDRKAQAIAEAFGPSFAYAGNGSGDRPIFAAADKVVLVGPVERLKPMVPENKATEAFFPGRGLGLRDWATALRPRHWAKNLLVFSRLFCGLGLLTLEILGQGLLLFFLFGLLASATYILNDLMDLASDRASGQAEPALRDRRDPRP